MNSALPSPTPAQEKERHGLVRVAAVAPALQLGDVAENVLRTVEAVKQCAADGCRLVVLPELGLTGYSCGDVFYNEGLLRRVEAGLTLLLAATRDLPCCVVVGLPWLLRDRLYNVAAVLAGGRLLGVVPKSVLPNSGEFYERRWFSPAATATDDTVLFGGDSIPFGTDLIFEAADVRGFRIAVELCEDLWSVVPPSSKAALAGATLLVNLSASNEILGKAGYRRDLVKQQAARCLAAYVYASAGPGESSTDLVFSGPCLIAENGVLLAESDRFDFAGGQAVADVDLQWLEHDRLHSSSFRDETPPGTYRRIPFELGPHATDAPGDLRRYLAATPFIPKSLSGRKEVCEEIFAIQATGLARRLTAARASTAVIGLSGGLDSTLAFLVMVRAAEKLGWKHDRLVAITMPGFGTSGRTRGNAETLAAAFGVNLRTISIEAAVRQHFADIGHPESQHDVVFENAQARERTQVLMDIANQTNGIVVGTGDLSEAALGWCTFNGDHMSMYHVNAGVPKTLVRYLIGWCAEEWCQADASCVLHDIIDTPISPELLPLGNDAELVQKTEDVVGPYELHDFFLFHLVRHGASREKILFLAQLAFAGSPWASSVEKWLTVFLKRFAQSQFKRSAMPDGPKVGSVALSPRGDWRMPSDWMGPLP